MNHALPTVTTRLPIAAPMMVPAAPSVESSTAEATVAKTPAIALIQSIWNGFRFVRVVGHHGSLCRHPGLTW